MQSFCCRNCAADSEPVVITIVCSLDCMGKQSAQFVM